MKLSIHLDASGAEQLAQGRQTYSWNFLVRQEGERPPADTFPLVEDLEVALPSREQCVRLAVSALTLREKEIYAEAAKEAREIKVRLENLLALEGPK
jgi:hypothetical protein